MVALEVLLQQKRKKTSHADFKNCPPQAVWQSILTNVSHIEDGTDFFKSGAASMDVVR